MKKILVLALSALAAGSIAKADYSLSSDLTYTSKYIFRGVQLGDNTLHPSIELTQNDFYVGMWAALPIDKLESEGWTNEYDFYLGYTKELSDKASVDVGATYYYYPPSEVDESIEGYLGMTFDVGGFTPAAYAYYDFDLKVLTLQGSVGYSIPMAGAGTSLDLSATYGHVDPKDGDTYTYYGVSAQVPYKLNDKATLTFGIHWADNDIGTIFEGEDSVRVDDNFIYYTAGITIGF